MKQKAKQKPYLLLKDYCSVGYSLYEFDTADEALQCANPSNGDIIAKRLAVRVVEEDADHD